MPFKSIRSCKKHTQEVVDFPSSNSHSESCRNYERMQAVLRAQNGMGNTALPPWVYREPCIRRNMDKSNHEYEIHGYRCPSGTWMCRAQGRHLAYSIPKTALAGGHGHIACCLLLVCGEWLYRTHENSQGDSTRSPSIQGDCCFPANPRYVWTSTACSTNPIHRLKGEKSFKGFLKSPHI